MAMSSQLSLSMPSSTEQLLRSMEESEDIVEWVNNLIDNRPGGKVAASDVLEGGRNLEDLSEMEKHLSHLSAVIEVACEDTSTHLERSIEDISRTVPRLVYDLQFMQENALTLNTSLQQLEQASATSLGDSEISVALNRLHFLDTVQRNMNASLAVLREAEAWSSLESEVVAHISEQSYAKAAARLSEAASSLGVFQNTPEYESRKTLMVNLQNQLEAALSSALVSAINGNDVDACKKYFEIFCNIERETEYRSYWNGSKRKPIVARWEGLAFKDCDEVPDSSGKSNSTDMRFASFLSEFYNEIVGILQTERLSAQAIFPDPQPTLSTFIASTLSSIHPTPSQRLSSLVVHYGDTVLPELISCFKCSEEFAVAVDKVMEKTSYSAPSPALTSVPLEGERSDSTFQRSHSRRKSHRQSISRRMISRGSSGTGTNILLGDSGTIDMDRAWEHTLFEPYLDYQCDYAALENRLLGERLKGIIRSSPAGSSAGARLLRERVIDVLSCAEDALTRCMSFTHGFGAVGLTQAIDKLFKSLLEISENDILNSRISDAPLHQTGGDEFADLDYSPADYAVIQLTLHLLEASRDALDRLGVLETKIRSILAQFSGTIKLMRNDPTGSYISGTTKGAIGLLLSSTLNSVDLQRLLDTVDPEPPQHHPHSHAPQTPATPSYHRTPSGNVVVSSPPSPLLLGSRASISTFAKACQTRLQKTILTPLLKHLAGYAALPVWSSSDTQKRAGMGELSIPTFSRSPTQAIQRVAEGLLSLPRLFEVYADDDALAFEIESLPFINLKMLSDAAEEDAEEGAEKVASSSSAEKVEEGDVVLVKASRRKSLLPTLTPAPAPTPSKLPVFTPEIVTSAWLASLALSLLSHLTQSVLPTITSLSSGGAAQLAEDLGYLGQIVKALNVQWEELELWRECAELDEGELKARSIRSGEEDVSVNELGMEISKKVLKIRFKS